MIKAVLIEFTRSTCCRKKGERMWADENMARAYVKRKRIAKIIKRKNPALKAAHAEM